MVSITFLKESDPRKHQSYNDIQKCFRPSWFFPPEKQPRLVIHKSIKTLQ